MKKTVLAFLLPATLLVACEDKDLYDPEYREKLETETIEKAFDFNLSVSVPVTLEYGVRKFVEVYDARPEENPSAVQLFAAYTDACGHYEGTMYIPAAYIGKTVYARTLSGVTDQNGKEVWEEVPATVKTEGVSFTSAGSRVNVTGQANTECVALSDAYRTYLRENTDNSNLIRPGRTANINILKDGTELSASFCFSGGECKIYYYYYKTGQRPENHPDENWNPDPADGVRMYSGVPMDDLTARFMKPDYQLWADQKDNGAVWGAWCNPSRTDYYCVGATSDLLFYGENYDSPGTKQWPGGYTVAFFLIYSYAFVPLYSDPELNMFQNPEDVAPTWGLTQAGVFKHSAESRLVYGWEDQPANLTLHNGTQGSSEYFKLYGGRATDNDYNDVVYVINVSPGLDHVDVDQVEEIPTERMEVKTGTLLFEDLYPEEGDYDMNDVVIEYALKRVFDEENNLVRIDWEFTPVHDGATYTNDFYFCFTGRTGVQEVFKNHKNCIGKKFSGTIPAGELLNSGWNWDDFNPFILVRETNREVHLTKKRFAGIGDKEGLSNIKLNYINDANSNYPFALNLPGKWNFQVVTERVRIDREYPDYAAWVNPDRSQWTHVDWYNHYKSE